MPFRKHEPQIPARLSSFTVTLRVSMATDLDGSNPHDVVELRYHTDVLDAQGQVITRLSGDLREHLNPTQTDRLETTALMLYQKAKAEVLAP